MAATPLPAGTDVSETINDKEHSRVLVCDTAGNDAFGLAVANPAQYSLLGRLKALVDTVLSLIGLTSPANSFFPITPGANPLGTIPNTIYVAGEGTLVVQGADGQQASFSVAAKSYHPIRPRYVLGASTATGIVGLI